MVEVLFNLCFISLDFSGKMAVEAVVERDSLEAAGSESRTTFLIDLALVVVKVLDFHFWVCTPSLHFGRSSLNCPCC